MDVLAQTTEAEDVLLAADVSVADNVSHDTVAEVQMEGKGTEDGACVEAKEDDDTRFWSLHRLRKETYMLRARIMTSSLPTLPSPRLTDVYGTQATHSLVHLEDEEKSRDHIPPDWVVVSKPGSEQGIEASAEVQTTRMAPLGWQRVGTKHLDLMAQRVKVREARKSLREARTIMRDNDTTFERTLRRVFAEDAKFGLKKIEDDYEKLQQSRELLRVQENEYDILENGLLSAEYEVRQLENEIYGDTATDPKHQIKHGGSRDLYASSIPGEVVAEELLDIDDAVGSAGVNQESIASTTRQSAADRLTQIHKQLKKLRRKMVKLDNSSNLVRGTIEATKDSGSEQYRNGSEQLRDKSERRSDIAVQVMLFEEDATMLEDLTFHQQDHFFAPEMMNSDALLPSSYGAVLLLPDDSTREEKRHRSPEKPPPRYLAFRDLRTRATHNIIHQHPSSNNITVSEYINLWLLQTMCTSQFSVLRLRAEIHHQGSRLKSLKQERNAAKLWFTDGSELLYGKGRQQDTQSLRPQWSIDTSRNASRLWESRLLTPKESSIGDGQAIVHYHSYSTNNEPVPDVLEPNYLRAERCLSYTTENLANVRYDNEDDPPTGFFSVTTEQDNPLMKYLDTRPQAIHYLLQLWNSPTFPRPPFRKLHFS